MLQELACHLPVSANQLSLSFVVRYDCAEWELAFLMQAREFLFFPVLPREVNK